MNIKQALTDSINALEIEKAFIESKKFSKSIDLHNGVRLRISGGNYIYLFHLGEYQDIPEDTPIEVQVIDGSPEKNRVKGIILSTEQTDDLKISLNLDENIGDEVHHVKLHSNPSFLLQKLIDQLKEKKLNSSILEQLLGYSNISRSALTTQQIEYLINLKNQDLPKLNNGQLNAVEMALSNSVTYIWGPPGTGKTTVIAAITNFFANQNERVLISSHTNVAIDNAIESVAKKLIKSNSDKIDTGKILRIGEISHIEDDEIKEKLNISYWVDRETIRLREEIAEITFNLEHLKNLKELVDIIMNYDNELESKKSELDNLKNESDRVIKVLATNQKDLENISDNLKKDRRFVKSYHNFPSLKKPFYWLKYNSAKNAIPESEINHQALSDQRSKISSELILIDEDIYQIQKRIKDLMIERQRSIENLSYTGFEITEENVEQLGSEIESLEKMNEEIETKIVGLKASFMSNANVLATTLTKTFMQKEFSELSFDVVIIDEASVAMIPQLLYTCGLAKKKIVIVGDFCQLASIYMAKDNDQVKDWLGTDIFVKSGVVDEKKDYFSPILAKLSEQYRMDEKIAQLVNKIAYKNELVSKKQINVELHEKVIGSFGYKSVVFVDIGNTFSGFSGKSHINTLSAEYAIQIARKYRNIQDCEIGIITPYRPQLKRLVAIKSDYEQELDMVDIFTVHTVQGREKEVIIVDLVNSSNLVELGKPLRGEKYSESMKLLNVAFSRAKEQLIILGSKDLIQKYPGSVISETLKFCLENDLMYDEDVDDLIPIQVSEESTDLQDLSSQTIRFLDERTFGADLVRELQKCKSDFVMTVPFGKKITSPFFNNFGNIFYQLSKRGVRLFAFVKPSVSREFINALSKIGFQILKRPKTHEKLYFIDSNIMYVGSQNPTWSGDRENMIKIKSRRTVTDARKAYMIDSDLNNFNEIRRLETLDYGKCPVCGTPLILVKSWQHIKLECAICDYSCNPGPEALRMIFGEDGIKCDEGHQLVLRKNSKGGMFLGCSKYPTHKFTKTIT